MLHSRLRLLVEALNRAADVRTSRRASQVCLPETLCTDRGEWLRTGRCIAFQAVQLWDNAGCVRRGPTPLHKHRCGQPSQGLNPHVISRRSIGKECEPPRGTVLRLQNDLFKICGGQ